MNDLVEKVTKDLYDEMFANLANEMINSNASRWPLPWGTLVRKKPGIIAGYSGPGRFRGFAIAEDGSYRFTIGHRIEGGEGELLHHYMPNQIEIEP